jgi:hypothetical protein
MKRSEKLLATALALIVAGLGPNLTLAAESAVVAQDLMNVKASGQVAARWVRQPESYAVHVMVERSKPRPRSNTSSIREQDPSPMSAGQQLVAEQLRRLVPASMPDDRASFFIANTITNLRGEMDPAFGCNRSLTIADGRRTVPNSAGRVPPVLPYDPKARQPRVEVWLLKADGTHIPSTDYNCISYPESTEARYEYAPAEGGQAVAAAIRIDNEYYIEKLQQLNLNAAP